MGESKRRKERFKADNPFCCFCGGNEPTTTIDHIPARTCFRNRAYPEGFEFPACNHCQGASRKDEMAFAFWVRTLDHDPANLVAEEIYGLATGLANNLPDYLPTGLADRREKRQTLRRMGLNLGRGHLLDDIPVVHIDPQLHQCIDRYARKIALALYYREQGRVASKYHRVMATWGQAIDQRFMERARSFVDITPDVTIGKRRNVDIGTQFRYSSNKADNPDAVAALAQFGIDGVTLLMLVIPQGMEFMLDDPGVDIASVWIPVDHIYPRS